MKVIVTDEADGTVTRLTVVAKNADEEVTLTQLKHLMTVGGDLYMIPDGTTDVTRARFGKAKEAT